MATSLLHLGRTPLRPNQAFPFSSNPHTPKPFSIVLLPKQKPTAISKDLLFFSSLLQSNRFKPIHALESDIPQVKYRKPIKFNCDFFSINRCLYGFEGGISGIG